MLALPPHLSPWEKARRWAQDRPPTQAWLLRIASSAFGFVIAFEIAINASVPVLLRIGLAVALLVFCVFATLFAVELATRRDARLVSALVGTIATIGLEMLAFQINPLAWLPKQSGTPTSATSSPHPTQVGHPYSRITPRPLAFRTPETTNAISRALATPRPVGPITIPSPSPIATTTPTPTAVSNAAAQHALEKLIAVQRRDALLYATPTPTPMPRRSPMPNAAGHPTSTQSPILSEPPVEQPPNATRTVPPTVSPSVVAIDPDIPKNASAEAVSTGGCEVATPDLGYVPLPSYSQQVPVDVAALALKRMLIAQVGTTTVMHIVNLGILFEHQGETYGPKDAADWPAVIGFLEHSGAIVNVQNWRSVLIYFNLGLWERCYTNYSFDVKQL
jgi:hypothetical protein